jgi:hypothetical protein
MTIAQAWQSASSIILLGPQEQSYGRYYGTLADCRLDGLRIGAVFVEFTIHANSQAEHYMFALDDFTLINVW